jgi:hypothetical protein
MASTNTDADGNKILAYSEKGQPATNVKFPLMTSLFLCGFSTDNKHFAYTVSNAVDDFWELHIIDVSDGSQRVVGGKLSGIIGAPSIIGWNPDGKHVYTLPSSFEELASGSPTEFDLSAIPTGDKPLPLPAGKVLLEDKYAKLFVTSQLSSDASKLAFSFFDETRPVPNFSGPGSADNTIGLYDVKTGETNIVYQAPKDETVMQPMWSADGTKLAWEGGLYAVNEVLGVSTLVSPKLYVFDVATGKVSDGASLPVTPTDNAFLLKVCGDTLFYMINQNLPGKFTSSLYSVPLSDLTKQDKPLHTVEGLYTSLGCVTP